MMMMNMMMTYSPQIFSVTAAVVVSVICLNSLLYIRTCARVYLHKSEKKKKITMSDEKRSRLV